MSSRSSAFTFSVTFRRYSVKLCDFVRDRLIHIWTWLISKFHTSCPRDPAAVSQSVWDTFQRVAYWKRQDTFTSLYNPRVLQQHVWRLTNTSTWQLYSVSTCNRRQQPSWECQHFKVFNCAVVFMMFERLISFVQAWTQGRNTVWGLNLIHECVCSEF